jgi:hypothetical protein
MRGHSPSKTGVDALMSRASILSKRFYKRDGLPVEPGNDGLLMAGCMPHNTLN